MVNLRNLAVWGIIIAMVLILVNLWQGNQDRAGANETAYSEFIRQV